MRHHQRHRERKSVPNTSSRHPLLCPRTCCVAAWRQRLRNGQERRRSGGMKPLESSSLGVWVTNLHPRRRKGRRGGRRSVWATYQLPLTQAQGITNPLVSELSGLSQVQQPKCNYSRASLGFRPWQHMLATVTMQMSAQTPQSRWLCKGRQPINSVIATGTQD